ncbi:MAG: Asp-tRNA(Asn)/Glu-tRNA(Gln) amidotransferase subunit GatC [Chloroflexota bacterium]
MTLSLEEVEHIAELARLQLSRAEVSRFQQQLSAILDYVASLQALDTSDIPPASNLFQDDSRLRPDSPGASLSSSELLQNAPQVEQGQFRVPPVLE